MWRDYFDDLRRPFLRVEYYCYQESTLYKICDWGSKGLEAELLLELLDSLPENLWYSQIHCQSGFSGKLVGVGMVAGSDVFSASLVQMAEGLFACGQNPFFNLFERNIEVVVEDRGDEQVLVLNVFAQNRISNLHD